MVILVQENFKPVWKGICIPCGKAIFDSDIITNCTVESFAESFESFKFTPEVFLFWRVR